MNLLKFITAKLYNAMNTKQEKRQALRDLSNSLKATKELDPTFAPDAITVNDLLTYYYKLKGHTELKTFKEWINAGYCVRKGETAFLLWATPIARKKKEETEKSKPTTEEEKGKEDFFPICCVFSNQQVSKLENGNNAN